MELIKEALTFDDVLLLHRYSSVVSSKTNLELKLSKKIKLKIPFLSSAMDTVTESKMASAMARSGGLGIIHRNLNIKKQCIEVKKVKKNKLIVGAAVGTSFKELVRAKNLIDDGVYMHVIDTAHDHSKNVWKKLNIIKKISETLNCGILLISHDLHVVMSATDFVVCLNGHVCCSGKPHVVVQNEKYKEFFGDRASNILSLYEHKHDHTHSLDGTINKE